MGREGGEGNGRHDKGDQGGKGSHKEEKRGEGKGKERRQGREERLRGGILCLCSNFVIEPVVVNMTVVYHITNYLGRFTSCITVL